MASEQKKVLTPEQLSEIKRLSAIVADETRKLVNQENESQLAKAKLFDYLHALTDFQQAGRG